MGAAFRVLVPTRGSLPALRACNLVARMLAPASADIRLFTVVNRGASDAPEPLGREPHPEVAALRGIFEKAGHSVVADQRVGDGPAEILNEIDTWAPDLVVMGRWRARAMERWMRGSVFDRVIRHVHVPVFMLTYDPERDGEPVEGARVVEGERPDRPFRVLVPTRGSVWALRASELAARMLPARSAQVRLLTVLPGELYPLPYTIEGQLVLDMPERLTWVAEAAEPAVAEPRAIFQAAGHDVDVHHRFGQPPAEILSEIKDWRPDLVVMGRWRGVSPFEWVSGSIFERIIRHAHVPVLIVK